MKFFSRIAVLFLLLLTAAPAVAREGTITGATDLRAGPNEAARPVAMLPVGSVVDIKERRGFWLRVQVSTSPTQGAKAVGKSGWVKFIRVRDRDPADDKAQQPSTGGFFSSLARNVTGLFGGSRNSGTRSAATTGIRGLSANEIETAAPDMAAVNRLGAYRASPARVSSFADQGALRAVPIAYLTAEPVPAAGDEPASAGGPAAEKSDAAAGEGTANDILKFFTSTPNKTRPARDEDEGAN